MVLIAEWSDEFSVLKSKSSISFNIDLKSAFRFLLPKNVPLYSL